MAKRSGCANGTLYKKQKKWWIAIEGGHGVIGPWSSRKKALNLAKDAGFCRIEDDRTGEILFRK